MKLFFYIKQVEQISKVGKLLGFEIFVVSQKFAKLFDTTLSLDVFRSDLIFLPRTSRANFYESFVFLMYVMPCEAIHGFTSFEDVFHSAKHF